MGIWAGHTAHRHLCSDDDRATPNAWFFRSFPLHFWSNCKAIPAEERTNQSSMRKTDANSTARISPAAHLPGDTAPESALLAFSGGSPLTPVLGHQCWGWTVWLGRTGFQPEQSNGLANSTCKSYRFHQRCRKGDLVQTLLSQLS